MPRVFKVECYARHIARHRAEVGEVVYLKSRPDHVMLLDTLRRMEAEREF